MFSRCPKCGHRPLPRDQALPAACPACGVILAKVALARPAGLGRRDAASGRRPAADDGVHRRWAAVLLQVPERVDRTRFRCRLALFAGFLLWGVQLIRLDHRSGEINQSFIHGPLLVFHEAGHVVFGPLGHGMMVLGGTLGQLIMPATMGVALLWKNRDPFGAALALWLLGVSLLDIAPYVYDALHPQLMLLTGATGEAGGHDWIDLLSTLGLRDRAQPIGRFIHRLGAVTVVLALGWAAWLLQRQRGRVAADVLHEE